MGRVIIARVFTLCTYHTCLRTTIYIYSTSRDKHAELRLKTRIADCVNYRGPSALVKNKVYGSAMCDKGHK